ncbi:MAG: class II glutamine amidotransferase, partial [Candidatus Paceibacterota bacterium]
MCGIFAYTGEKDAGPLLLDGLAQLEYRGYDSAGVYVAGSGAVKAVGAVGNLRNKITTPLMGHSGIAHLRWATHGEPTEVNAHPHRDCSGEIWVVHNGIIENFKELKQALATLGHSFISSTDTEVIAHLVEEHMKRGDDFEKAAFSALNEIKGTYGIALSYAKEPDKIIGARMGAPLVVGIGEGEHFIASDASPILKHTRQVVYLHDGEVVVIAPNAHSIYTLDSVRVHREAESLDWSTEAAQKGGYEHFMLKEIMEGPEVIENTLRGRLLEESGTVKL